MGEILESTYAAYTGATVVEAWEYPWLADEQVIRGERTLALRPPLDPAPAPETVLRFPDSPHATLRLRPQTIWRICPGPAVVGPSTDPVVAIYSDLAVPALIEFPVNVRSTLVGWRSWTPIQRAVAALSAALRCDVSQAKRYIMALIRFNCLETHPAVHTAAPLSAALITPEVYVEEQACISGQTGIVLASRIVGRVVVLKGPAEVVWLYCRAGSRIKVSKLVLEMGDEDRCLSAIRSLLKAGMITALAPDTGEGSEDAT